MDDDIENENDSQLLTAGAAPSNTHLQTSQPSIIPIPGTVSIDWWEVGACVKWNFDPTFPSQKTFKQLGEMKEACQVTRQPQFLTVETNHWHLLGKGRGGGKGAYFPFQLVCEGITVAFGQDGGKSRQYPNFAYTASGETCLLVGVPEVERRIADLLLFLGGKFADRWCRRIDICLDTLYPDLCETLSNLTTTGCSIGSIRAKAAYLTGNGLSGVAIGQGSSVQIRIYDKLRELPKKSELYQLEILANRWGGEIPKSATRIEYQVKKDFLTQHSLKTADEVLRRLPDLVARLTQLEPRPTFAITTEPPDRENNHQSRAAIHPLWAGVSRSFQEGIGKSLHPLKRVERGMLNNHKAIQMIVGFIISSSVNSRVRIARFEDAVDWFQHLCITNQISDDLLKNKWDLKAKSKNLTENPRQFEDKWEVDREDVDGPRQ